ncbi:hypothetical protein HZS_612, partial [Henneguya salminicola]
DDITRIIEKSLGNYPISNFEKSIKELKKILNNFIDHPHLMDSSLEKIFDTLFINSTNDCNSFETRLLMFEFIYEILNMRKFKGALKFINHDEKKLSFVLNNLKYFASHYKAKYCLLGWLISILKAPFILFPDQNSDLLFDTIDLIKVHLCLLYFLKLVDSASNSYGSAVGILSSTLLTRTDISESTISEFIQFLIPKLLSTDDIKSINTAIIALRIFTYLFKKMPRVQLILLANEIMEQINIDTLSSSNSFALKKNFIKLIQRIAMIYLKPKQNAFLFYSKNQQTDNADSNIECVNTKMVNKIIRIIIFTVTTEKLFQMMGDPSYDNRYSCSKGIARIGARLDSTQRNNIIDSVVSLFKYCIIIIFLKKNESSILANRLLLPFIIQSLTYEEHSSNIVAGASIRDAACYVLWSFARAFPPSALHTYIPNIVLYKNGVNFRNLVLIALYDSQLICRRAASASLQEIIGRQGIFEGGTELTILLNFQSVSNPEKCYLELSPSIARVFSYVPEMTTNLIKYRLCSIYKKTRELSGKCLGKIAVKNSSYFSSQVLPILFDKIVDGLNENYINAIVEILHGIYMSGCEICEYSFYFLKMCEIIPNVFSINFYKISTSKFSSYIPIEGRVSLQLATIKLLAHHPILANTFISKYNYCNVKVIGSISVLKIFIIELYIFEFDILLLIKRMLRFNRCQYFDYFNKNVDKINGPNIHKIGIYLFITAIWPSLKENHLELDKLLLIEYEKFDHYDKLLTETLITWSKMIASIIPQTIFPDIGFPSVLKRILNIFCVFMHVFKSTTYGDFSRDLRLSILEILDKINEYIFNNFNIVDEDCFNNVLDSVLSLAFECDDLIRKMAFKCLQNLLNFSSSTTFISQFDQLGNIMYLVVQNTYRNSLPIDATSFENCTLKFFKYSNFYQPLLSGWISCYNSSLRHKAKEILKRFIEEHISDQSNVDALIETFINIYCIDIVLDERLIDGLIFSTLIILKSDILTMVSSICLNRFTKSCFIFLHKCTESCNIISRIKKATNCLFLLLKYDHNLNDKISGAFQILLNHPYPQVRLNILELMDQQS